MPYRDPEKADFSLKVCVVCFIGLAILGFMAFLTSSH